MEIATGRPNSLVIFPTNTALPIVMAFVAGGFFIGMLIKAYWLVPLSILGVAALAIWWAWSLGSRKDQGPQPVGHGLVLPLASEVKRPPGWWGSLFLLLANGVFFGSLLFGYAFLWTVAPSWPPPAYLEPGRLGPALALGGAVLALAGIRMAIRALRRSAGPWLGLFPCFAGTAALGAAAVTVLTGMRHNAHAYDATLWVVAGYVLFHAAVAGLMTAFLGLRAAAGYLSARRVGEARVVQLWSDYAAVTALLGLGAAWLPGALV